MAGQLPSFFSDEYLDQHPERRHSLEQEQEDFHSEQHRRSDEARRREYDQARQDYQRLQDQYNRLLHERGYVPPSPALDFLNPASPKESRFARLSDHIRRRRNSNSPPAPPYPVGSLTGKRFLFDDYDTPATHPAMAHDMRRAHSGEAPSPSARFVGLAPPIDNTFLRPPQLPGRHRRGSLVDSPTVDHSKPVKIGNLSDLRAWAQSSEGSAKRTSPAAAPLSGLLPRALPRALPAVLPRPRHYEPDPIYLPHDEAPMFESPDFLLPNQSPSASRQGLYPPNPFSLQNELTPARLYQRPEPEAPSAAPPHPLDGYLDHTSERLAWYRKYGSEDDPLDGFFYEPSKDQRPAGLKGMFYRAPRDEVWEEGWKREERAQRKAARLRAREEEEYRAYMAAVEEEERDRAAREKEPPRPAKPREYKFGPKKAPFFIIKRDPKDPNATKGVKAPRERTVREQELLFPPGPVDPGQAALPKVLVDTVLDYIADHKLPQGTEVDWNKIDPDDFILDNGKLFIIPVTEKRKSGYRLGRPSLSKGALDRSIGDKTLARSKSPLLIVVPAPSGFKPPPPQREFNAFWLWILSWLVYAPIEEKPVPKEKDPYPGMSSIRFGRDKLSGASIRYRPPALKKGGAGPRYPKEARPKKKDMRVHFGESGIIHGMVQVIRVIPPINSVLAPFDDTALKNPQAKMVADVGALIIVFFVLWQMAKMLWWLRSVWNGEPR